jgi:hypothetical protein
MVSLAAQSVFPKVDYLIYDRIMKGDVQTGGVEKEIRVFGWISHEVTDCTCEHYAKRAKSSRT